MFGFVSAGYLIYNSFHDWAESPTITSVETFPISEVPFPEVTVCPPLGSNTALNYDLMTAVNITIDVETRNKSVEMKGLTLSLFAFAFAFCILHFEFKFPAKNSEFFRFKYLNFPPKNLDSIAEEEGGHGDNIGTSSLAFSVKPKRQ